jgi:hypothetical protein
MPFTAKSWIVGGLIGFAHVLVFMRFAPAMLQDWPDHVARAVIIDDLTFHQGVKFGAAFQFSFMAVPYILNDLLLAGGIELVGAQGAMILCQVFIVLALPAALVLYARVTDIRPEDRAFTFILGLYLVTIAFYLRGFLAFGLALAAIIVLLAVARMLCRSWSYALYACYVAALGLSYLVHLSVLVLVAPALVVSTMIMIRRRRIDPIQGAHGFLR